MALARSLKILVSRDDNADFTLVAGATTSLASSVDGGANTATVNTTAQTDVLAKSTVDWVDEKNPPVKVGYDAVNQRLSFELTGQFLVQVLTLTSTPSRSMARPRNWYQQPWSDQCRQRAGIQFVVVRFCMAIRLSPPVRKFSRTTSVMASRSPITRAPELLDLQWHHR